MSNQRNIKLVGIAGLVIVAIAGGALVAYPLIGQTQRWSDETVQAQEANDVLKDKIVALQATEALTPEVIALNAELAAKFPNLPNGTDLLQDISSAAVQSGMSSENIESVIISAPVLLSGTPGATTDGTTPPADPAAPADGQAEGNSTPDVTASKVASMDIAISVSGTGPQLSAFMVALGETRRTIKIDTVAIKTTEEKTTMDIKGTSYLYASIEAPTLTTEPTDGTTDEGTTPTPAPTSTPVVPTPTPTGTSNP